MSLLSTPVRGENDVESSVDLRHGEDRIQSDVPSTISSAVLDLGGAKGQMSILKSNPMNAIS